MLCVREELSCMEHAVGDDKFESLWITMKGQASEVDVIVEVYDRLPSQDDDTD